jgi:peptide/nickel transport system substrate-binding protein
MNGLPGTGTKAFFLLFLLIIIILLQLLSQNQFSRFSQRLNSLEKIISIAPVQNQIPAKQVGNESSFAKATEDEGDWLVWALAVEPKTLNLISSDQDIYTTWMVFETVFEPLMAYDYDEVKLKPCLAKSCQVSDDGLEITYTLRDDIHFSDGVPITADDVIFTYQTLINPKIDAQLVAQSYVDVDRVERIDDKTVKFYMKRSYFLAQEVTSLWQVGVFPKHIYQFKDPQEFNKRVSNPIGSGPYVFEKWDTGDKVTFRRNENYWGTKPKIKKVIYKFIINDKARLQALRSGDVDMMIPAPEQYAELIKDKNFTKDFRCVAYWSPGTPYFYIGWNEDTPFFADRQVRLAMTEMLDRKGMVKHLLKDSGEEITGPYQILTRENDPNIQPWPYDPNKTAQLLDEAGWKDHDGDGIRDKNGVPFRFKFAYAADNGLYQNIANVLKDSAAKVGIEVIADPVEWSVLITRINDRKFESMIMGWGGQIIEDQYQIFHSSQIGKGGSNYVGFKNAEADKLLEQIRRTMDEEKRIELSRKFHSIVHYEQPYTFLFSRPTYRIISPRFENVIIHKLGLKEEEWYVPKDKQKYK